jgi:hypothetical protein
MFMDLSSEMIHALLPVYLVTVLGASALTVGFIEGIAEATANITKIFSGALSDRLGKRKLLAAIGYGLAASAKPAFPLASSVGWLVAARFIDRVGKGIRGAPRDALVADIAPAQSRGRNCDAGGEHGRRGVMGCLRPGCDLPCRSRARRRRAHWPSGHISAAKYVIFPHARSPLLRFKRARRKSDASRMKSRLTHARPSSRFPKRS